MEKRGMAHILVLAFLVAVSMVALVGSQRAAEAAFPGSNGAIAFSTNDGGTDSQIYRMSAHGFGQELLSDTLDVPGANTSPEWSADGNRIVFMHRAPSASADIYWMNSDGSDPKNLTNDGAEDDDPAFFPDYHEIAFASNREPGGDMDIFKMTVNDSGTVLGLVQLTTSTAQDGQPSVSPDGSKIAFQSNRGAGANVDIYVMSANTPESASNRPVRLTKSVQQEYYPDWSPSGKKIAFMSNRTNNEEIYVMKAVPESSTNRPKNLTNNAAYDDLPAWSPDGRKIAFVSNRDGNDYDIFKMRADGTGTPVDLTSNLTEGSDDETPSWQPDP